MRVFPINTLLPKQEVIEEIVSLGSGKLPEHVLVEKANKSELSYLRIVKPQFVNSELQPGSDEFYSASVFYFNHLLTSQFIEKYTDCIFYYEQSHHSGNQLGGWIMGVDGDDYLDGKVKRHENTITAKENRLVKHINVLKSMAEPVLLSQVLPESLKHLAVTVKSNSSKISVIDEYQNLHQLWVIQETHIQKEILNEFVKLDSLYIADGHHRVASSSRYLIDEFGHNSGKGFMALIMNEDDLLIKPFYRIISSEISLNELQVSLSKFQIQFEEVNLVDYPNYLSIPFRSVICFNNDKAMIIHLPSNHTNSAVDSLDVTITERQILGPFFNIYNSANNVNIRFQRGDMPISEMMKYLRPNEIGFLFHSNSMAEIRSVADQGDIMPPKSTFIEPKLLTGFIVETY